MDTFEDLSKKRYDMVSLLIENNIYEGFKNLLTQLYPDNAHYIYELLQNAQDANKDNPSSATVRFTLTEKQLEFEHNCKKLFDIKDIDSITGLGISTKIDDKTNIGKFGVGFKSVFAITNTPEIISGKYHFYIEKLFIPKLKSDLSSNELTTSRFIFPFNNPNKTPEKAFEEIENQLHNLGSETLLFLRNINKLEYKISDNDTENYLKRKELGDNIIEIRVKNNNEEERIFYWLRYDDNVSIIDEKGETVNCPISIAFKLEKEDHKDTKNNSKIIETEQGKTAIIKLKSQKENYKIIKAEQGKVCIFFPSEKENSKLFFYIHAPFASTVARDSIRECDENNQLRDKISNLFVKVLPDIKKRGLLTIDFLGILPNSHDNLSYFYKPILNDIINTFQNEPILPTKNGDYAPASTLFRGPVSISDIITDDDLSFLTEKNIPLWAKNAPQQNQREDRFLDDLRIKPWGNNELSFYFNTRNQHDIDGIQKWITTKSDNWLLRLYALFGEIEININNELPIIRTTTNQHTIASNTYFLPDDEDIPNTLNFVKPEVFSKNDTEKRMERARLFLTRTGVKTYNDKEKIKLDIKRLADKYKSTNPDILESQHLEDIDQFVKYEEISKELLKDKYFILDINENYCKANTICSSSIGELIECANLSSKEEYRKTTMNSIYDKLEERTRYKFYSLLEILGVMNKLKVVQYETNDFLYRNKIDYKIIGIENILPLINEEEYKISFSLLIWNAICVCNFDENVKYKQGLQRDGRHRYYEKIGPSKIVEKLSSNPWLPDANGTLFIPQDISLDMLPNEFQKNYNQNSHILNALKFGVNITTKRAKERLETQKRDEAAKTLGITLEQVDFIKQINFDKISDKERFFNELIRQLTIKDDEEFDPNKLIIFPEDNIKNLKHLQEAIRNSYYKAPDVKYEDISTSTRTSRNEKEEKEHLKYRYKGHCQICKSSEYSYEVAEIFLNPKKEIVQMNLSLCPNCASLYRKLRNDDALMSGFKDNLRNISPEKNTIIPLENNINVHFTQTHLAEIQEILRIESGIESK